ncbi:MAG: class I SAM-dependent methyltransferase [Bacteroidetes bacterium]|nr:class I SAM-dependent methyltransferase [Bacteroidota bacterium]
MDKSNGYESISSLFIKTRGAAINGIGASTTRAWAKTLRAGATVLDLGCGTGLPNTKVLIEEGLTVYAIDASPTLANKFHDNFPDIPIACEAAEDSSFFDRSFDAILSVGLMFLLPEHTQIRLIPQMATALNPGGRLLFTSTTQIHKWKDAMTDLDSHSLGAEKYKELLTSAGLTLLEEFTDEGGNHYYQALKK